MTKAMDITKLQSEADFAKDVASIARRAESVQMDIHRHLYAIAFRWNETGDVRPAVLRVNALIDAMPKGIRVNAIREWVEVMLGFEFVEADKATKISAQFKAGSIKGADLPMDSILNKRWFELKQEAPYKPIDFGADLMKLLKRAGERASSTKGDTVDPELLVMVQRAVADHTAKQAVLANAGNVTDRG